MSNVATPTVLASPEDAAPLPVAYLRAPRMPVLPNLALSSHFVSLARSGYSTDPPPGTTRVIWRGDQPAQIVPTAELADFLTRECGRGWEYGADNAGFEGYTVRDDEGDVLAELEEF